MKRIIVLTGASGTGKTTISHYLQTNYQIKPVITHTTRKPRSGEKNGVDYYFETPVSFKENNYIEQVEYAGNHYGSSVEGLERAWQKNDNVSIVLDTAGAISYDRKYPQNAVIIFLTVSQDNLIKRLTKRSDNQADVKQRISSPEFKRDLTLPRELNGKAIVINNDDIAKTKVKIDHLIQKF